MNKLIEHVFVLDIDECKIISFGFREKKLLLSQKKHLYLKRTNEKNHLWYEAK